MKVYSKVGHLMRWLYDVDDLEELWKPVTSLAEAGGFCIVREDNVAEVNAIVEQHGPMLVKLKEKIRTELTWQTVAAKSLLNWRLVKFAEGQGDYDQEWLSMSESDIKSLEHSYAQRQRDMSVAMRAAGTAAPGARSRGGRRTVRGGRR